MDSGEHRWLQFCVVTSAFAPVRARPSVEVRVRPQALSYISGLIRTQGAVANGARLASLLYNFVQSDAWTKYDMIFLGLEDGMCAPGARACTGRMGVTSCPSASVQSRC
jgi:hypothetical protein